VAGQSSVPFSGAFVYHKREDDGSRASGGTGKSAVEAREWTFLAGANDDDGDTNMTGIEALQSVQFVTVNGRRLAVLSVDDWECLVEWLETLEDTHLAREARRTLQAAGGDREKAGWLRWDDVKEEL
jgi:hypothetical protein